MILEWKNAVLEEAKVSFHVLVGWARCCRLQCHTWMCTNATHPWGMPWVLCSQQGGEHEWTPAGHQQHQQHVCHGSCSLQCVSAGELSKRLMYYRDPKEPLFCLLCEWFLEPALFSALQNAWCIFHSLVKICALNACEVVCSESCLLLAWPADSPSGQ